MMLLIHFRYPALGVGIPVDYQRRGAVVLYLSTVASRCFRARSTCGTSCRRRCKQSRATT